PWPAPPPPTSAGRGARVGASEPAPAATPERAAASQAAAGVAGGRPVAAGAGPGATPAREEEVGRRARGGCRPRRDCTRSRARSLGRVVRPATAVPVAQPCLARGVRVPVGGRKGGRRRGRGRGRRRPRDRSSGGGRGCRDG